MAADEMVMALKKAYVDILLNTAKEAATRIMASERKAQRFQLELQAGKDEALRMLLRLKRMMDSKLADGELASLSQQKKIDELEAQLQEAEDIVKDLREELREVQSELEQLRNNKPNHLDEQYSVTQRGISVENEFYSPRYLALLPDRLGLDYVAAADSINSIQFQSNERMKFYGAGPHLGNLHLGCPDLPSIILRSKEPVLYRKGCTQRIRASERDLSNRELSLSSQMSTGKNKISAREDTGARQIISDPSERIGNSVKVSKKISEVNQIVVSKRKRATRNRKKCFSSSTNFPDQAFRIDKAPGISSKSTYQTSIRSDTDSQESPLRASRSSSDLAESGFEPGGVDASKDDKELANPVGVQKLANDVTELNVHAIQKTRCDDISGDAVDETCLDGADILFRISEENEFDIATGSHCGTICERSIRYTYQRKRKRESFAECDGVAFLENTTSMGKMLDDVSDTAEESNLIMELS